MTKIAYNLAPQQDLEESYKYYGEQALKYADLYFLDPENRHSHAQSFLECDSIRQSCGIEMRRRGRIVTPRAIIDVGGV